MKFETADDFMKELAARKDKFIGELNPDVTEDTIAVLGYEAGFIRGATRDMVWELIQERRVLQEQVDRLTIYGRKA